VEIIDLRPAFDDYGPRRRPPRAFIVHHTNTPHAQRTRDVLARRGLSTHIEVTKAGDVLLYLDPATKTAWHAGSGNNADTIGIDLTHMEGEPFPQAQLDGLAWVIRHYADQFAIPIALAPDRCVITHAQGCQSGVLKAPDLIRLGYGIVRHRNVHTTVCPDNLPLERVVSGMRTGSSTRAARGGILASALAVLGGFLAYRLARGR